MPSRRSRGICRPCGKDYTLTFMKRHLSGDACRGIPKDNPSAEGEDLATLSIEAGSHWLIVEMPALATLYDLDFFLRKTWLECCGHLSGFTPLRGHPGYYPMRAPIALAFEEKAPLVHQYDMGSTIECVIELLAVRRSQTPEESGDSEPVRTLARNSSDERFNTPRAGCDGEGLEDPFPEAAHQLLEDEDPPQGELSIYIHAARGTCCDCHSHVPVLCENDCRKCRRQCPCRTGRCAPHTYPERPNFSLDAEIERAHDIDLRTQADPVYPMHQLPTR